MYTCGGQFSQKFLKKCSGILKEFSSIKCCYEVTLYAVGPVCNIPVFTRHLLVNVYYALSITRWVLLKSYHTFCLHSSEFFLASVVYETLSWLDVIASAIACNVWCVLMYGVLFLDVLGLVNSFEYMSGTSLLTCHCIVKMRWFFWKLFFNAYDVHFLLRFAQPCLLMWSLCLSTCGYVTCVQSSWIGTRNSLFVWNVASRTKVKSVLIIMYGSITRYHHWLRLWLH